MAASAALCSTFWIIIGYKVTWHDGFLMISDSDSQLHKLQRVNGRIAMMGFAGAAAAELSNHTPVLEQFSSSWFGVLLFTFSIGFASIVPKVVSGTSLKDLHAAASGANLGSVSGKEGPCIRPDVHGMHLDWWHAQATWACMKQYAWLASACRECE